MRRPMSGSLRPEMTHHQPRLLDLEPRQSQDGFEAAGISTDQAERWEKLAAVPDNIFRRATPLWRPFSLVALGNVLLTLQPTLTSLPCNRHWRLR